MPFPAIDLRQVKTVPLMRRQSLVALQDLISPEKPPPHFDNPDLPEIASRIVAARRTGRPVICMIGAHVVKCGLSPILIEFMRRGIITHLSSNGAATIHDFEIALTGNTSEDVASSLEDGSFGMAEETGRMMNLAIRKGSYDGLGMGEALGKLIAEDEQFKYRQYSLLYNAYQLRIPYTVHVALGTDIIHQHPECDFAALGSTSGQDFKIFIHSVTQLENGVFCNFGSAVIGPEVFLKAVSIARNLGNPLKAITTANFDLVPLSGDYRQPASKENPEYYYRPKKNIIIRPPSLGGRGYHITGDHRLTIPNLYHLIKTQLDENDNFSAPVQREDLYQDWKSTIGELIRISPAAGQVLQKLVGQFPALQSCASSLVRSFRLLTACFQTGGTLFICGNGGSFADALHIAGELGKSFKLPRPIPSSHRTQMEKLPDGDALACHLQQGLRTIALGTNPSLASAIENDNPQRYLNFAQELYVLGKPGDVLLGISTSGQAKNVIFAAKTAQARGLAVLALTGPRPNPLHEIANVAIQSPGEDTPEIQGWHLQLYHALCEMLEQHFFGGPG